MFVIVLTKFERKVFDEVIKLLKLTSFCVNLIVKGSNFLLAVFGHVRLCVLKWSLPNEVTVSKDFIEVSNLIFSENIKQLTLISEFEIKEKLSNDCLLLRASLSKGGVELIDDSEVCS